MTAVSDFFMSNNTECRNITYSIRNDFIPVGFSKADQIDLVSLGRKREKGDMSTKRLSGEMKV